MRAPSKKISARVMTGLSPPLRPNGDVAQFYGDCKRAGCAVIEGYHVFELFFDVAGCAATAVTAFR
jgi:hypothetical protein